MTNYLVPIDLAEEEFSEKVVGTAVQMATGVEDAQIYLMTVIPGIPAGIDVRYAVRGEMHGSADYPLQEWKEEMSKRLGGFAAEHVPQSTLADFLLGPNSARVARHAGCTVTVVREK